MTSPRPGRLAVLEQFAADGFDRMFGNPGTVEQGLLDELRHVPDLQYVLTLHETVAVMTADGYARAGSRPALVQIHSTPGLGNAVGALYQAHRGHAPLVVIGGDAGVRYQPMAAQMAGDLVGMARPVTKWAAQVSDPASVLRMVRRAIKIAATPPTGPVYLCLPADVLDADCTERVVPTVVPDTRVAPDDTVIADLARRLAAAERPVILAGDGVAFSGAHAELAAVAELVGAQVWDADAGEVTLPHTHPCHQGSTGHMFGSHSLPILQHGDVVLVVGTYVVPEVFPELGEVFRPDAHVAHVDLDTDAIAKNHRVDTAVAADPRRTLAALARRLHDTMPEQARRTGRARVAAMAAAKERDSVAARSADAGRRGRRPLDFSEFAEALARRLDDDAVVVDEALTNSPALTRYRPAPAPGRHLLTRGGSLGIGFPGAIGAKLAVGERTVVGVSGDGGSMYTAQALWTAARHRVDTVFVVCNNRSYRLLQSNIGAWWREQGLDRSDYPTAFDLSEPPIRFDTLAESMGVTGIRVEKSEQIGSALDDALDERGPVLLDVVVEGDVHPELVGVRCGQ
ncbi:MAG: thiamine pyrophosphate-binding protein [Kineosporiaceae bacterium]